MYTANYQLVPRQYTVVSQGVQGTNLAVQMSPQGGTTLSPGEQFSQPAGFEQHLATFPNQNQQHFTFPNQNPQILPNAGHPLGLAAQNLGQINAGVVTGGPSGQNVLIQGHGQGMIVQGQVQGQTIIPQNPTIFHQNPALNSPQENTASHHTNLANVQAVVNSSSALSHMTGYGSQLVPGQVPMINTQMSPLGSPNSVPGILSPDSSRGVEVSPTTGRKRKLSGQKSKLRQQQETVIQLNNQLQLLQQMQQNMLTQNTNTVNMAGLGTNPVIQNLATQNQTLPSFGHFLLHHQQQHQQGLPNQNAVDVQHVDGSIMSGLQMVGSGGSMSQNPTNLLGGQNVANIFPTGPNMPYHLPGASNLVNTNMVPQLPSGRVNIDLQSQIQGANLNVGLNNQNSPQFTNNNANLLQIQGQSGTGSFISGGFQRTPVQVRQNAAQTHVVQPVCVTCVSKTTDTVSMSNIVKTKVTQDPKSVAVTSVTFGISTIPTSKILSPKSNIENVSTSAVSASGNSKLKVSKVKLNIPVSENGTSPNTVIVPFGWVRQLEEESIVYYR